MRRAIRLIGQSHPWQVVIAFTLVYLVVILALNGGDPKAFVTIGDCYSGCDFDLAQGCPDGTENGYDGQYAYYIARDPGGATGCMDVPAYRYQRILLPLLGYLFSFGVHDAIPLVFVAVNLFALAGSTALLERMLVGERVSRWYALVYALFFGTLVGVRLSTTEPLAFGLLIAALYLEQRGSPVWMVALLVLAGAFAKEVILVSGVGIGLYYLLNRRWKDAAVLMALVPVPFMAWQLYLLSWIGEMGIGSGGGGASGFEIIPYAGVIRMWTETGNFLVLLVVGALVIPLAVLPSMWGIWASARLLIQRRSTHLYPCIHFMHAVVLVTVPYSTYREFLGVFRFLPGLVLTHLLLSSRFYRRRPLVYSTLWLLCLAYLVSG